MKRFAFRLEQLLELRKYHEHECEIELGKRVGVCEGINTGIEYRKVRRADAFFDFDTIDSLYYRDQYIVRLQKEIGSLKKELRVRLKEMEEAREKFALASRDRKIIDKLKEKRYGEYRHAVEKDDQEAIDDINSARYAGGVNVRPDEDM